MVGVGSSYTENINLYDGQFAANALTVSSARRRQGGAVLTQMRLTYILDGSWMNVDPNLPDAATTILRIYKRQMRQWESMYTTNRGNGILYFGGVQEGDRIVLHNFDSDTSFSPISYWIFHDIQGDSYSWHAETSRDRGKTFQDTWKIEATRRTQ